MTKSDWYRYSNEVLEICTMDTTMKRLLLRQGQTWPLAVSCLTTTSSGEANEARLPDTCSRPCAFEKKKEERITPY